MRSQPRSPDACQVATDRAVPERERRDARNRRHRLVQVQDVEPLALEDPADPEEAARAQDDVRQRPVRRHDHRAPDRQDVRRRLVVPPVARVQRAREVPRRVVADQRAGLEAEPPQRLRLELGVLDDSAPERPAVRDDDADLHCADYALTNRGHGRRQRPVPRSPRRPPGTPRHGGLRTSSPVRAYPAKSLRVCNGSSTESATCRSK